MAKKETVQPWWEIEMDRRYCKYDVLKLPSDMPESLVDAIELAVRAWNLAQQEKPT